VSEDPLVTFAEFTLQCLDGCAQATEAEIKDQWDEMLEVQHEDPRKRVKDKQGEFMLVLVGQGKKVMRDVSGQGTRTRDVVRENLPGDADDAASNSQSGNGSRLASLFGKHVPPSTKRYPSRQPSPARSTRSRRNGPSAADDDVRPEDSISSAGNDKETSSQAAKKQKLPFGSAKAAAEGKTLTAVEFLQAKVGHVWADWHGILN